MKGIVPTLASLTFSEFASKSFIQQACQLPKSPQAVLSFFFGTNYFEDNNNNNNTHVQDMREGKPMSNMMDLWYTQSDEYDELCRSFVPVIRQVLTTTSTEQDPQWTETVDGLMSQVLLADQLSRNCFRGTEEAFRYDPLGVSLTLKLLQELQKDEDARTVTGEFYPPYLCLLMNPLMHSEDLANHELGVKVLDESIIKYKEHAIAKNLQQTKAFLLGHKQVVDQFGRYPHRNAKLGRETTAEEQAWLDDVDNLPAWAKSQG